MEYVTRYGLVSPIKTRTAESIASEVSRLLHTFGLGRELISDNAGELAGKICEEMCRLDQMSLTHPTPHRHQMTGLMDRFGRTFGDMMASYVNQLQDDWDIHCFKLQYASNTATNRSMNTSPFKVMFGRDGLMPDSARLLVSEPYSIRSQQAMVLARKVAREELLRSQVVMSTWYDRKCRTRHTFKLGDRVWVFSPWKSGPDVGKHKANFRGPYVIENVDAGHDNLGLVHETKKNHIIAHISFLYPYRTRDRLMDEEAMKLMDAFNITEKERVKRPMLYEVDPPKDALEEGEVTERRRVLNKSGRPEVRFALEDSSGMSSVVDIDGNIPPTSTKRNKRSRARDEDIGGKRLRSGGTLDPASLPDRQRSVFGLDVNSLFEDVDDGSHVTKAILKNSEASVISSSSRKNTSRTADVESGLPVGTTVTTGHSGAATARARSSASKRYKSTSKGIPKRRRSERVAKKSDAVLA